jgi:hypothetical protein
MIMRARLPAVNMWVWPSLRLFHHAGKAGDAWGHGTARRLPCWQCLHSSGAPICPCVFDLFRAGHISELHIIALRDVLHSPSQLVPSLIAGLPLDPSALLQFTSAVLWSGQTKAEAIQVLADVKVGGPIFSFVTRKSFGVGGGMVGGLYPYRPVAPLRPQREARFICLFGG